ncbi:MAG: hypothetical protein JJ992_02795 [Planctomycetes bacterium]|nr:hypothetical protein [Planctomycetota bacterium]
MPADDGRQTSEAPPSLGEILDVIRPHVEKIEEGFTAIRVTLDALATHLSGSPGPPASKVPAEPAARGSAAESAAAIPTVEPVAQPSVAALPPRAAPVAAAPQAKPRVERPEAIAVTGADGRDWSRILFGEHLRADPSITHLSGSLLGDVYAGDTGAIALAGQLMTFRTGTAEQKARLLKDVGEAFYNWKPQGDEPLLEPLITWVHAELDDVSLGNRIMVVQVGDRYDMQRHNARQSGVEVAEVYGWIVLRDNGKVFSKANVALK